MTAITQCAPLRRRTRFHIQCKEAFHGRHYRYRTSSAASKALSQATGQFTGLLYDLILSGKTISRRINKAGLLDILGGTGEVNVQGENVQKMDSIANRILLYRMERCGALCAMAPRKSRSWCAWGRNSPAAIIS